MLDDDRIERRNQRREGDRRRLLRERIMLAVFVCVVAAGGAGATAATRAAGSAGGIAETRGATSRPPDRALPPLISGHAAIVPTSAPGATVAAASGSAATAETVTPALEPTPAVSAKTPAAGSDARARAAVSFPGAPAIEPVTITRLKPKHKYVAITLDDGYGFQPEMLKLLRRYDARCTTFLVGSWAANNLPILKKLDAAGFEIANHTWMHETLTTLSASQERRSLLRTQETISKVTGNQAPYVRPPGGATNSSVASVAAGLGYTQVLWSRTFGDSSRHPSAEKSYHWVMEYAGGVQPGDIILCHWGRPSTLEAMRRILPELKARGFEFVTVSELIADSARAKKK